MKPVDGIKQTWNRQWPTASDHQEHAERAAHILRILTLDAPFSGSADSG